jgi:hypothetical protein
VWRIGAEWSGPSQEIDWSPLIISLALFERTAYVLWCDISWAAGVTKHLSYPS